VTAIVYCTCLGGEWGGAGSIYKKNTPVIRHEKLKTAQTDVFHAKLVCRVVPVFLYSVRFERMSSTLPVIFLCRLLIFKSGLDKRAFEMLTCGSIAGTRIRESRCGSGSETLKVKAKILSRFILFFVNFNLLWRLTN
jgi:hypothetical protein